MRFFKKTVFWVLIFVILGGSFYMLNRKSEEKKAEAEVKKRLFSFEPADVTEFTIKKKDGAAVSLKKEGGAWVITSPVNAPGDPEAINVFLDRLVGSKLDGVLYEKAPAGKFKEMGLANPYLTVELTAGGSVHTVFFGDTGPTHNVSYAAIKGDERILRVNTSVRADAEKDAYDLRDKAILKFDPTKVRSFEIKWADGGRISVEHPTENKWNAVGLKEGKTDFSKVMEMLLKFKKSDIKAFVDENPTDLGRYGLKAARVRLTFIDEKGAGHSVSIGERDKEKRGYYAIRDGARFVFMVEEDVVDSIPREVGDLEEKADAEKK